MKWTKFFLAVLCAQLLGSVNAEVKLSAIFSDNMVIQQHKPIHIWGWAAKGESVEVRFLSQHLKTKADRNGQWSVTFKAIDHGGPYQLEVNGKNNRVVLNNILIGEVWLCSGQSNMEFMVKNVMNASIEISRAAYPNIRSFNVVKAYATSPKSNMEGTWQICSPQTVPDFSAVAYFFARNLYEQLGVPIGIINASWGGTDIETWMSEQAFAPLPNKFQARYEGNKIKDIDQFMKENKERKSQYYKAINQDPGISGKWFDAAFDITPWKTMELPQYFEPVIGDIDGIVWYACDVVLPPSNAGKTGVLQFGPIDDNDVTWINGEEVGRTNGYMVNRQYRIPEDLLKEGLNRITVKVTDDYGGGGFYGRKDDMYLDVNGTKYPLSGKWAYKASVTNKEFNFSEPSPNMQPSLLFNAMIHPIISFPIAGVIWYQGENNVSNAYNYKTLFPSLINDWRKQWNEDLPFYWVQLANYLAKDNVPSESVWAELRAAQSSTLSLPNTGEAVITDIGDANDIHPKNKQEVGKRLALIALKNTYGKTSIVASGPTYRSMNVVAGKIVISFDNVWSGLFTNSKYGYLEGFAIAGADRKFVWAKAYIDGDKVVVYSDDVKNPLAVRYAWGNNPDVNLFNKEGLPAAPFQTDNWKWTTDYDK